MNRLSGFPLAGLVAGFAAWGPCAFAQTITTTPTFNNIGVVVDLAAPTTQPVVRMFVKASGAPTNEFREVHPLSRLTATRFAGSAFGLKPGTSCDFTTTSSSTASMTALKPTAPDRTAASTSTAFMIS